MRVDLGDGVRVFVDVNGLSLVPDGPNMRERPTVVLLHGGPGDDHSSWKADPAFDLTDVAQVIYYDHRGNGRSDAGSVNDWTLDVWADDVVRLCEALGIERPIVMGSSFGGFVAQRYLARHPGHAAAVVLISTSARVDIDIVGAAFGRFGGPVAEAAARAFWTEGPAEILGYLEHCMPLYSTTEMDIEAMGRSVMNLDVMGHFQAGERTTMDLRSGLAESGCPVMVIGGELDPICPIEMSEEIVEALAPSNQPVTFVRVPGRSHDDAGVAAVDDIRRFITSI